MPNDHKDDYIHTVADSNDTIKTVQEKYFKRGKRTVTEHSGQSIAESDDNFNLVLQNGKADFISKLLSGNSVCITTTFKPNASTTTTAAAATDTIHSNLTKEPDGTIKSSTIDANSEKKSNVSSRCIDRNNGRDRHTDYD